MLTAIIIPVGLTIASAPKGRPMSNIHQEIQLPGSPADVYTALVDCSRFSELTGAPASGDAAEGAAFSAFGGHIAGRHVELVPGQRVVQAWRAKTWPEGLYSIARFELRPDATGTLLVFDHTGFPEDMKEHLSQGWVANYWQNLEKYLSPRSA
jgi:activator of HSP90 ATPase